VTAHSQPQFPALLCHDDGSISVLRDLDTWSADVDLWYFSEPSDFLVDSSGTRFDQTGERRSDGRPVHPPTWHATRALVAAEVADLVLRHLTTEHATTAFSTIAPGASTQEIVDYVASLDT
jgi:hypothetical protein